MCLQRSNRYLVGFNVFFHFHCWSSDRTFKLQAAGPARGPLHWLSNPPISVRLDKEVSPSNEDTSFPNADTKKKNHRLNLRSDHSQSALDLVVTSHTLSTEVCVREDLPRESNAGVA